MYRYIYICTFICIYLYLYLYVCIDGLINIYYNYPSLSIYNYISLYISI